MSCSYSCVKPLKRLHNKRRPRTMSGPLKRSSWRKTSRNFFNNNGKRTWTAANRNETIRKNSSVTNYKENKFKQATKKRFSVLKVQDEMGIHPNQEEISTGQHHENVTGKQLPFLNAALLSTAKHKLKVKRI